MDLKKLKADLKKQTDKSPEKFYAVKTLKASGYHREHCKTCGKYFWTTTKDKICGDPNCAGGYSFIGEKVSKNKLDFIGVWKEFSGMFKKLGYTPIKRYPVVARWRDDTYWNNASIYDFQPYVVNGEVEPPANPLVVPQPCVRFNDIDNVGITGRHYTSFIMIGQHAFYPKEKFDQEKYFADIMQWLEKGVGLKRDSIKYHEDQWGGGGNMGPCMEFFANGLELGNQVYMKYEITESGNLRDLKLNVLDMGMGQERYSWITQGTSTSYEANMPTVVKQLYGETGVRPDHEMIAKFLPYSGLLNFEEVENLDKVWQGIAKKMKADKTALQNEIMKLGALYSVAEHTRTLLFALSDGALPSNVGGQYNLRVLYRRMVDLIQKYGWTIDVEGLFEEHSKYLKPQYPELSENLDEIFKILRVEREKYNSTLERSRRMVAQILEKKEKLSEKKFMGLYDTHGITPELVEEEAKKLKIKVKTPENFYAKVAEIHPEVQTKKEVVAKEIDVSGLPETEPVYYTDTKLTACKSKILKIIGNYIVLDKTVFYPTGGGQQHDNGTLGNAKVVDVVKVKGVILHQIENATGLKVGQVVEGKIDADRRKRLARNHDSAHMLVGASRAILGKHIWQAGSHIEPDKGRLDITHYQNLTEAEKIEIEKLANKIISEKRKITKTLMQRNIAEEKYGFALYQGGAVPGKLLRVVEIENFDTEACGGTHNTNTADIEQIKILKTEKIQDGVIRLVFAAGKDLIATKELDEKGLLENTLNVLAKFGVKGKKAEIGELGAAAQVFKVKLEDLPKTFERFFSEAKDNQERIEDLEKLIGERPERGEELLIKELNSAKDLSVIARVLFEHWKGQKKRIGDFENQLAAKTANNILQNKQKVGDINLFIGKADNPQLAIVVAHSLYEKVKNALIIIQSETQNIYMTSAEGNIDYRKIFFPDKPIAKEEIQNKRAIGIGKTLFSSKEIEEIIRNYSK